MSGKIITTTLRKICSQTKNGNFDIQSNIPADFSGLSYADKYEAYNKGCVDRRYHISAKGDFLMFSILTRNILRNGRRIFTKTHEDELIVFRGNSLLIKSTLCANDIRVFFNIIGVEASFLEKDGILLKDDCGTYGDNLYILNKSAILKAVITGRIYNEETFIRRYAQVSFGLKKTDWKLFKKFIRSGQACNFNIADIRDFTKDFDSSLRVVLDSLNASDDYQKIQRLRDLLKSATQLNEVVNFRWSDKRIKAEHDRQIEIIQAKAIAVKTEDLIHPADYSEQFEQQGFHLLNSEKEVFCEASLMHNCQHSCYYPKMVKGNYLAFRVHTEEGNVDVGLTRDTKSGKAVYEQAHTIRNGSINEDTRKRIYDFIERNSDHLKKLLERGLAKNYQNAPQAIGNNPFVQDDVLDYDDMPF